MMLKPCCPSAGPTGGAGVALPAGMCSLISPITFLAIRIPLARSGRTPRPNRGSDLLHLQEAQLDRRGAAEDGHHHIEGRAVLVDLLDLAREVAERAVHDLDVLSDAVLELRLRLLGGDRHLLDDAVDLVVAERDRLVPGPDEAGHPRRVL